MSDAWSYLPGASGDAWSRMAGDTGDSWARLPGPLGDAWERLTTGGTLLWREPVRLESKIKRSASFVGWLK